MSLATLKNMLVVLGCAAGLALTQSAQAQVGIIIPRAITIEPIPIGDVPPPDALFYDNSTFTNGWFVPPTGAFPCEVADDVPFTGTYHVDSFTFAYATNNTNDHEIIANFYSALMADDGPASPATQSIDMTGLPGSPDGSIISYLVTVDLVALAQDFNWTNSVSGDGTYHFNWVSFTFEQQGAGLLTASGGGSMDYFWTGTDLNSPYEAGSFYWYFGGTPSASFYLQVSGHAG